MKCRCSTPLAQFASSVTAKDNPLSFEAVLGADERAEILSAGERELDAYGLGAEFVPVEQGGRLSRLDRLIEVMRTVVRRDPVLGFGYGTGSLMAAVNVWTSGTPAQRRSVADLLLNGGRLACAFHELAHGNDLTHAEFSADPRPQGLVLNGRKQVVGNLERADAMVLFARTGPGQNSRSHSQLLIDKAALPADGFHYLPRHHTSGLRGMELGGMEFLNCLLPADTVVGALGQGLETALRAFVLEEAREPMRTYVAGSLGLFGTGNTASRDKELRLSPQQQQRLIDASVDRYFRSLGLFGAVDKAVATVEKVRAMGVDEIACLIDFGAPVATVLAGLDHLNLVRRAVTA